MTAQTLIDSAFDDLGIKQVNQSIGSADVQDALARLNRVVNSLRTESLTVLAIERSIFSLTANQQTYTIGLGGTFNVPRPQGVNGAGLLLNGLSSAQAVALTRSGTTATGTLAAHGFAIGQEIVIAGATQIAYNGEQTILTVPTVNTFTFQVFNTPTTPATGSPTAQSYDGTPVEIPRALMTDDAYQAVQLKTMTSPLFTNVYYNATQPLGTIWLWPCPTTAAHQLVLYLQTQFQGFTDLTTDYTYPDMPGYADLLEYSLAERLIGPYSVTDGTVIGNVKELLRTARMLVKRANYKPTDLATDPALTANRRGGYNINTDSGGHR